MGRVFQARWEILTSFSQWPDRYVKTITVRPGPGQYSDRLYQREVTRVNGVVTYSADYPADSEYARERLDGLVEVEQ